MPLRLALVLSLLTLGAGSAPAQGPPPGPSAGTSAEGRPPLLAPVGAERVEVDLVVRDKDGRLVRDLRLDEVEVLEDGVRQDVESLTLVEHAAGGETAAEPVYVALAFDRLGPASRRFARRAALEYLAGRRPGSEAAVFAIDRGLTVLQGFTDDAPALRRGGRVDDVARGDHSRRQARAAAHEQRVPRPRGGTGPGPRGRGREQGGARVPGTRGGADPAQRDAGEPPRRELRVARARPAGLRLDPRPAVARRRPLHPAREEGGAALLGRPRHPLERGGHVPVGDRRREPGSGERLHRRRRGAARREPGRRAAAHARHGEDAGPERERRGPADRGEPPLAPGEERERHAPRAGEHAHAARRPDGRLRARRHERPRGGAVARRGGAALAPPAVLRAPQPRLRRPLPDDPREGEPVARPGAGAQGLPRPARGAALPRPPPRGSGPRAARRARGAGRRAPARAGPPVPAGRGRGPGADPRGGGVGRPRGPHDPRARPGRERAGGGQGEPAVRAARPRPARRPGPGPLLPRGAPARRPLLARGGGPGRPLLSRGTGDRVARGPAGRAGAAAREQPHGGAARGEARRGPRGRPRPARVPGRAALPRPRAAAPPGVRPAPGLLPERLAGARPARGRRPRGGPALGAAGRRGVALSRCGPTRTAGSGS